MVNFYEKQNGEHTDKSYEQAYKLLVLFGRKDLKTMTDSLKRYTKNFNFKDKENYLDEIVDFNLPVCPDNLDLQAWRVTIMKKGPKAAKLFDYAAVIQHMLGHTPKTFEEIKKAVVQVNYARFQENPELAELCFEHALGEDVFHRALEYTPNPDKLPDVVIRGTGDDENYYLVKLPYDDPRAYVLGKIVNCCQYVGGEGELPTRSGIQYDTNGFYVLLKSKKNNEQEAPLTDKGINYEKFNIVGQGLAWLNDGDNLTIDSWENLRDTDNPVAVRLLKEFGQQVVHTNSRIMRVTVGSGSKTPPECGEIVPFAESMLNGKQYNDSWQQRLIALDQNKVERIKKELSSASFRHQAEKKFKNLPEPEKNNYIFAPKFLDWQGNFLDTYVFNENFYSSAEYPQWVKGVFENPKALNALTTLLSDKQSYGKFCDYLAKRGPVVWKSLDMLVKNGFDLEDIFEQQFRGISTPNVADIALPLVELKQNGVLNHPMFKRKGMFEDYLRFFSEINTSKHLKNSSETPRALSSALIALHKTERLFQDKYIKVLFSSQNYETCAQGMIRLEKANLLDKYFELIDKNIARDVMWAVGNLHEYNILDKCEQVIRNCTQNKHFAVSNALIKLHNHGLLDAYLPYLEQYSDKANLVRVCNVLVNLHQAPEKAILSEDLQVFNNPNLIHAFKELQRSGILTDKIQQLILFNPEHCKSITEDLILIQNNPETNQLKHPELVDLYKHLISSNTKLGSMKQEALDAILANINTKLNVNDLIERSHRIQSEAQVQVAELTVEEPESNRTHFFANLWQKIKNVISKFAAFFTSSSTDNDEPAPTESVQEAQEVKIACSYSRMARRIPANEAGTAEIPQPSNNTPTAEAITEVTSMENNANALEQDADQPESPRIQTFL